MIIVVHTNINTVAAWMSSAGPDFKAAPETRLYGLTS